MFGEVVTVIETFWCSMWSLSSDGGKTVTAIANMMVLLLTIALQPVSQWAFTRKEDRMKRACCMVTSFSRFHSLWLLSVLEIVSVHVFRRSQPNWLTSFKKTFQLSHPSLDGKDMTLLFLAVVSVSNRMVPNLSQCCKICICESLQLVFSNLWYFYRYLVKRKITFCLLTLCTCTSMKKKSNAP